ncbi:MAG: DNA polymerase III subunit beta [Chlamydiae bacterium]|nr:DNA polymerase III subunit beta [Chlamydiota bacterium]
MKAVVSKQDLVAQMGKIQNIIANKPAIPVISNILITAVGSQLIISATDLTTSMLCFIDATIIEEGAIALPAKRFFHLIRELTSPQIKISSLSPDQAEITSGSSVFKINGIHKNEFPSIPNISNAAQIRLQSSLLKEMLSKTYFAAARDDSRLVLNGIHVKIANGQAVFLATDAKRISKVNAAIDVDPSFHGSYILPIKAAEEMIKMLPDSNEQISLGLTHDKIFLESGNLTLITKLLSGQYPDVEKVIPETTAINMTIHKEELFMLLRQVALFTTEANGSVRFIFDSGELKLNIVTSNIGEGSVSMPVDYSQTRLEVAFNPYYFMDILRHIKDEVIKFGTQGLYNPGVISDSSNAIFVIMPMKFGQDKPPQEEQNVVEKPTFV